MKSKKEQCSSFEIGQEKRPELGFSRTADHGEFGKIERELDRLFREFQKNPGRTTSRKLTPKAPF